MTCPIAAIQNRGILVDNAFEQEYIGTGAPEDAVLTGGLVGYTVHSFKVVPQHASNNKRWIGIYLNGFLKGESAIERKAFKLMSHDWYSYDISEI
jgi:hypothetical protein